MRQTHSSLNSSKLKIKDQEYKTFPVPNLNILIFHIIASLRRRRGGKGKYRAGRKGSIVGKDTKTTRKVATSMRKTYKHKVKIQKEGGLKGSIGTEISGRTDFII